LRYEDDSDASESEEENDSESGPFSTKVRNSKGQRLHADGRINYAEESDPEDGDMRKLAPSRAARKFAAARQELIEAIKEVRLPTPLSLFACRMLTATTCRRATSLEASKGVSIKSSR
jgi:hypothetical protein